MLRVALVWCLALPIVAVPLASWAGTPTLAVGFSESRYAQEPPIVWIAGHDWSGPDVVITADDPGTPDVEYVSAPLTPDAEGDVATDLPVDGSIAGWDITASDGVAVAEITLPLLTIDRVDTATDTVFGTADVGLTFDVDGIGGGARVTTDATAWSATLPEVAGAT